MFVLVVLNFTIACQTKSLNNSDLPRAKSVLNGVKKVGLILDYSCQFEREVNENKQEVKRNEPCGKFEFDNRMMGPETQVSHSLYNIFSNWQFSNLDKKNEDSIIHSECKSKILWLIPVVDLDSCISDLNKRRKLMSESNVDSIIRLNVEVLGRKDDRILKNLFKLNGVQPIVYNLKYRFQLYDEYTKEPIWLESMESSKSSNEYDIGVIKLKDGNGGFLENDSSEKFIELRKKMLN